MIEDTPHEVGPAAGRRSECGKNARLLTIILVIGLFLRVAYGISLRNDVPVHDAAWYDLVGMNLVQHGQFCEVRDKPTASRGPGYPLFLAGIFAVFGHNLVAARLIQALVSAATCFLIFLIGREVFDEETGLVASAISGVYPHFIYYSGYLLIETLYCFLVADVVLVCCRLARKPTFTLLAVCGLLFSLTVLTKASFLVVLPLFLAILLFVWGPGKRDSYKHAAVIVLFFLAGQAPWVARNYLALDSLVLTESGGGLNLLRASRTFELYDRQQYAEELQTPVQIAGAKLGEIERDRYFRRESLAFIAEHPWYMIKLAARKFSTFWGMYPRRDHTYSQSYAVLFVVSVASFVPLLLFAVFGAATSLRLWRQELFLYGAIVSFTLLHMVFWSEGRYRVPIMPYVILFAAHGMIGTFARWKDSALRQPVHRPAKRRSRDGED